MEDTINPFNWRYRVALLVGLFVLVMTLAVVTPRGSDRASAATTRSAVGYSCVSRNSTHTLTVSGTGLVIGRATFHATGCYWSNNVGVKSLSFTVDGYANAPYYWRGVIGSWTEGKTCSTASTCTHNANHLVIKGKRVEWDLCAAGSVGCVSVGTVAKEAVMDSYGNLSIRNA